MTHLPFNLPSTKLLRGYTLVELMVAIVISFILIAAVLTTFAWSTRNYDQDDSTARQQENARFALDAISTDLRMTGFMYDVIDFNSVINTLSAVGGDDCGPGNPSVGTNWALNLENLVESYVGDPNDINSTYNCIAAADVYTLEDTDIDVEVLAIKRVKTPRETDVDGGVYLQTAPDGQSRLVALNYVSTPSTSVFNSARNWEYLTHVYYIKNVQREQINASGELELLDYPVLFRKVLEGTSTGTNNLTMVDESNGIADGIEYFHVTWGIDHAMIDGPGTTPDGQPNYYVSSPTTTQMPGVVAAQIHVLVRSPNFDKNYVDEKTYTLGDLSIPASALKEDNVRRKVFTTTVKLRNPVIRNTALNLINSF